MKDKSKKGTPAHKLLAVRTETHDRIRKMAYEQNKSMAAVVYEMVEKVGK